MRILTLDVTLSAGSVGTWEDGRMVQSNAITQDKGQAQILVPLIQDVIARSGWSFNDLTAIGVTTGPGSFTGVRMGLATAQGLGLALNIPVLGISTFDALAHSVPSPSKSTLIAITLDTRRQDSFVQLYSPSLEPLGEPFIAPSPSVQNQIESVLNTYEQVMVAGDGTAPLLPLISPANKVLVLEQGIPSPDAIARLTVQRLVEKEKYPPVPLYLRGADVTISHPTQVAELMKICLGPDAWTENAIAQVLRQPDTYLILTGTPKASAYLIFRAAADEGEILSIGVHPSMQRQGMGRQVLTEALNTLKKKGVTKVFLEVAVDNFSAFTFYTQMGFKPLSVRPKYYSRPDGTAIDAQVMVTHVEEMKTF